MEPDQTAPTQGTDAAAPQGEAAPVQQEATHGVQARINELTANWRQEQNANNQLRQQMSELMGQVANLQTQRAAPEAPVDETDPVKHIMSRIEGMEKKLSTQFAQQLNQLGAAVAVTAVSRAAAAKGITEPVITQRAEDLAAGWRAKGLPFSPDEALNFAVGEYYSNPANRTKRQVPARAAGSDPVINQAGAPFAPVSRAKLPSNLDQMSPDQQYAELEKAGIGDQEF